MLRRVIAALGVMLLSNKLFIVSPSESINEIHSLSTDIIDRKLAYAITWSFGVAMSSI